MYLVFSSTINKFISINVSSIALRIFFRETPASVLKTPNKSKPIFIHSCIIFSFVLDHFYTARRPLVIRHAKTLSLPPPISLLGRDVGLDKHGAKLFQLLLAADFLHQQRHLDDVKVLGVQLFILIQVFCLHLAASVALVAVGAALGEEELVDDNRVSVDAVAGELLNHALRLVQAEELGDADAHKGGELGVLELGVDLGDGLAEGLELLHHVVEVGAVGELAVGAEEAVEQGAVLRGELGDLGEGLFEDRGELEEAEGVAGGGGVEDDGLVGEGLDLLEDFGKGHGLVDTGNLYMLKQDELEQRKLRERLRKIKIKIEGRNGGEIWVGALVRKTYSKSKILHHATHAAAHGIHIILLALTDQKVLHAAVGINLHGAEVVKAVDEAGLLAEFLRKGIRQVVRGVGRDEQHRAADLGELDGERARGGGLADTALAADKDPAEGALVKKRLQRRLESVVGGDDGGRHGYWCCGVLDRRRKQTKQVKGGRWKDEMLEMGAGA